MRYLTAVLALLGFASWTLADGYNGTYTADGIKGAVTLVLAQDKDNNVSGTMASAGGKLIIRAKVQDGSAVGLIGPDGMQGSAYFRAQREGASMTVLMADMDANGQPRLTDARSVVFKAAAEAAAPAGDKPVNPLAAADAYAGTFKGDAGRLAVEILPAQGQYTGTIRLEDKKFAFKAAVKDGQLQGSFESDGNTFDFTAAVNGNILTLKAGNTTYLLEKERKAVNPLEKPANPLANPTPANPLDKPTGDKPADAKPAADDKWTPLARGKVYKHATGGTLHYPQDWEVKEVQGVVQLVPPNQGEAMYMVLAEDAQGITRPDDPKLIQALEMQIAQNAPLLRRVGTVEAVKSGSQAGAGLAWEVTGQNGLVVRAQLYVTIIKGKAVYLLGLGAKAKVVENDKALREIFSTFAWEEAQIDRELLGTWHYWSYSSSGLGTSNLSSTETRRTVSLKEDGTFAWQGNSEGYLSAKNTDSGGNVTSSGAAVGNSGTGTKGTWAAADGKLYLTGDNGMYVAVKYEIKAQNGNSFLYIDAGGKKPQEWSRNKVN